MQKGFLKQVKRGTALIAAFALTVSGITAADVQNVQAASKAPSLSASKISIKKGKTKKVTVKKKKNVTVKKVTWKINSGKNIVKFDKKTNTYARIKALKKGKAVVSAKIKVGKKTYTRKVTVTVTETKKPVNPTKAPATEAPTKAPATEAPTKAPVTDTPATDTPVTDTPATEAPTKAPEAPATEAPATEAPTKAPAKETATPYPYITAQPDPTAVPDYLDGIKTVKASWNDGTICNLSPNYAGKKMKITLLVKEVGEENPSGNVMIKSNYNGYPTLATVALSTEWTPVEIEYRFNNFTGSNPVLYFDDENKGVVTDNMTLYYKDLNFEELEGVDLLGGTALTKASWHKGVLGSFVKATHENKQVRISFKLREKGVENPSGTCDVQSNYPGSTYPTLKTGIPLTTDWTEVSFDTTIGTIGNQYPSIYLNGSAITDDMEMFMDEFKIEVIGDAPATPTPEVTPEPAGPTPVSHDVNIQGENAYDSAKGGIYVETTGATAWGTAFGKYGANYGLTDKTFSSVIVDLEFYKEGSKVTSIDAADCLSVTVASSSNWGDSASQEKQEYNVGAGQTTISGTNMVANTIVFQWKKAAADLTAYDAILIKSIKLVEASASSEPEVTPTPAPVSHDVNIQGENAYDSAKGGIYVETTGATAWGTAFGKYGANYGLTDKTFSSVIVDLEFYKEGSKVTSIDAAECISVTVSSDGSDWGNSANKEKQEYNVGAGQTTLSGTNMVANAVVFQWKKAAADITAYDAILIKSIKLVE